MMNVEAEIMFCTGQDCTYVAWSATGSKLEDEQPKSASLITPFDINKLVGFMSLCMTRFEWRKARPDIMSSAYFLMIGSASAPNIDRSDKNKK